MGEGGVMFFIENFNMKVPEVPILPKRGKEA
jgi:hypothetical protein